MLPNAREPAQWSAHPSCSGTRRRLRGARGALARPCETLQLVAKRASSLRCATTEATSGGWRSRSSCSPGTSVRACPRRSARAAAGVLRHARPHCSRRHRRRRRRYRRGPSRRALQREPLRIGQIRSEPLVVEAKAPHVARKLGRERPLETKGAARKAFIVRACVRARELLPSSDRSLASEQL